jgi:hypothetical protein
MQLRLQYYGFKSFCNYITIVIAVLSTLLKITKYLQPRRNCNLKPLKSINNFFLKTILVILKWITKNTGIKSNSWNHTTLVDEPMKSHRTPKAPFPLRLVIGCAATCTSSDVIWTYKNLTLYKNIPLMTIDVTERGKRYKNKTY